MHNLDTLVTPFMTSGIIGTTLSMTLFTVIQKLEDSLHFSWGLKYTSLPASICFLLSYFFTLSYIVFQIDFLLKVSLSFLFAAGIFLFILIIILLQLSTVEKIIDHLKETNQFPELFSKK